MVHGKSVVLTAGLWLIASALLVTQVTFAEGGRRANEVEIRRNPEFLRQAEVMREIYRSEAFRSKSGIDKRVENAEAKDFLSGKKEMKDLSRDALESLQSGYGNLRSGGKEAREAISSTHEAAAKRMSEVYKSAGIDPKSVDLASAVSIEQKGFKVADGMSEKGAAELTKAGGVLERMAANPEFRKSGQAGVHDRVLQNSKDLLTRAEEMEKKGGEEARVGKALRDVAILSSGDPMVINEVSNVTRDLIAGKAPGEMGLAIEGLGVILRAGEVGKYGSKEQREAIAKEFAGEKGDAAQIVKNLEAAEKKVFDEAMAKVGKNRNLGELKGAKSLEELMTKIDALLAEKSPTSAEFKALKALREEIAARRFIEVMNENPRFKQMTAEEKVNLIRCAGRANGWGSRAAKIGLVTGLVGVLGVGADGLNGFQVLKNVLGIKDDSIKTPEQLVDADKFTIPNEMFGEKSGLISAGRPAGDKAPVKGTETHDGKAPKK